MSINKKENDKLNNQKVKEIMNINNTSHNKNNQINKNNLNENYQFGDYNFNSNIKYKSNTIINPKIDKEKNLLKEKDKKIEILQEKCESLQKQLLIKTEFIIKKEKEKEKVKENIQNINNKNINNININFNLNTSNNFPIKSEIKKIWEEFALMSILDNFIDYENKPEFIFFFVTEMIVILGQLIDDICKEIYEKVSVSLNIKNDKKFLYDIEKTSRPLIKEYLNRIFINTEQKPFINKFIDLYRNSLKIKLGNIKIENILSSNDFFLMIKKVKDILLFTKFNDPPLLFNIEQNIKKRKFEKLFINNELSKKNFLIINDNSLKEINCIIILKCPIMKNGFPLNNNLKTIIMLDENNQKISIHSNNKKENEIEIKNLIDFDNNEFFDDKSISKQKFNQRNSDRNGLNIDKYGKINKSFLEDNIINYSYSNYINNINTSKNYPRQNKNYNTELNKEISKFKNKKYNNLNDNCEDNIKIQNENIISNFSFISENLNTKNHYNSNSERSIEPNILSENRGECKQISYGKNLIDCGGVKNNLSKNKPSKNNKKIKKINFIKKNKIKININKINNKIQYNKNNIYHKKILKKV